MLGNRMRGRVVYLHPLLLDREASMRFGPIALILIGMMVASATEAAPPVTPRPLKQESYGESITAVALLENNTYLLVQVLLTNAGLAVKSPSVEGSSYPHPENLGIRRVVEMMTIGP